MTTKMIALYSKRPIEEVDIDTNLIMFGNGQEFMDYILLPNQPLPHLVFLDLNMPIKNGMECLVEIRKIKRLQSLSVAIYSTSSSENDIEETFIKGANIYINKPNDFKKLKKIMLEVLKINWQYETSDLNRDTFLLRL